MRSTILFFFAAALMAQDPIVSAGFKAGIPASSAVSNFGNFITPVSVSSVDTGRWTLGPTFELRLYRGFSLEVDALYRSYRNTGAVTINQIFIPGGDSLQLFNTFKSDTRVWDLPLLLKYRFLTGRWRPFLDAGYSWSFSSSDTTSFFTCQSGASACAASPFKFGSFTGSTGNNVARGPVVGVGVEFKVGKIKVAPEIRYTHPSNARNVNQVTVLAGFTF
jgi:hypothetical protein